LSIDQYERASRAWPILIEKAAAHETVTYGDLGRLLGVHHRAIRFVLGVLQDYCLEEKLPPLTVLVVNRYGIQGSGFIALGNTSIEDGLEVVFDFDWRALGNPFALHQSGDSFETYVKELATNPNSASDVYTAVRSRGIKQMIFRAALLKVYSRKCAFTNINLIDTLQACHIVPWAAAQDSERLDVRNGLLLNCFHHLLFDAGMATLTVDYRIVLREKTISRANDASIQKALTADIQGRPMRVPSKRIARPLEGYICRHHDEMAWSKSELEL